MSSYSYVGRRHPRPDAADKTTGRTVYGHDLVLPRMLEGKILRSPLPHARIRSIDVSRASKIPGVKAILVAADLPSQTFGFGNDRLPLAAGKVRRVGDEVAAVAAAGEDTALEALDAIRVDYEPLPGVFDPESALAPGAPLIHEGRESNLFQSQEYAHGDPDRALAEADVVVEDRFELPYVLGGALEPSFCAAAFEADGSLTLYSTTQIPFLLQNDLSKAVGIPGNRIRIVQAQIGGSFGRGLDMYAFELVVVHLARRAGRPVRIAFDRAEEFAAAPVRQPVLFEARSGARRDGTLLVRDVKALLDIGAYVSWGAVTPLVMMETFGSLYRVGHVRFAARMAYTNNPVTGAVRGFGNPQATFVVETQMDQLARELGIDPVEFRLANANRPFEETPQGLRVTSCGLSECIGEAATRIGWRGPGEAGRASPPASILRRGIGFASTMNVGGGARIYRSDGCGAIVKVDDFGRATLTTGATEIGQGLDVSLAQIVAEELGVDVADVVVSRGDTAVALWDVGVHASRTTFIAGSAALLAARDARRQIIETASDVLGVPPDSLEIRAGEIRVRGDDAPPMPVAKAIRSRHFRDQGRPVIGTGWYDPKNQMVGPDLHGNISATYGFGTHAAEVEVDVETGKVRVLRIVAAHDIGRAINPMTVEGQIEGGIHMGLGYATTEELLVREGRIANPSFLDYRMPTALDMPRIETVLVETIDPEGPFGAKGVGEMGTNPVAAAVANAVFDAIGVRLTSLPLSPEKVVRALEEGAKKE